MSSLGLRRRTRVVVNEQDCQQKWQGCFSLLIQMFVVDIDSSVVGAILLVKRSEKDTNRVRGRGRLWEQRLGGTLQTLSRRL